MAAGRCGMRRAFTLVELLVSLAVLTIAMTAVATVFAVTTRTASQAAAYSEVQNWTRQFLRQIQEDLRHVDPAAGPLILHGRKQAAYLTAADREAGRYYRELVGNRSLAEGYDPAYNPVENAQYSDPRIDLLAFVTQRPLASQAPALNADANDPYLNGVRFAPNFVVYGHAARGQAQWNGSNYDWPDLGSLEHIASVPQNTPSPLPANQWHLARRSTILRYAFNQTIVNNAGDRERLSLGAATNNLPGDVLDFDLPMLNYELGPVFGRNGALRDPYTPSEWTFIQQKFDRLMYVDTNPGRNRHFATVLDEVPLELQSNLAVHMLPGCAWFQVEFLMPEDPRNSVAYSSPRPNNENYSRRSDMPRWMSIEPDRTYVFVPDSEENRLLIAAQRGSDGRPLNRLLQFGRLDQQTEAPHTSPDGALEQRIIRTWPYALRITVRVVDARGRLDPSQAIVRSVVHRFE